MLQLKEFIPLNELSPPRLQQVRRNLQKTFMLLCEHNLQPYCFSELEFINSYFKSVDNTEYIIIQLKIKNDAKDTIGTN